MGGCTLARPWYRDSASCSTCDCAWLFESGNLPLLVLSLCRCPESTIVTFQACWSHDVKCRRLCYSTFASFEEIHPLRTLSSLRDVAVWSAGVRGLLKKRSPVSKLDATSGCCDHYCTAVWSPWESTVAASFSVLDSYSASTAPTGCC